MWVLSTSAQNNLFVQLRRKWKPSVLLGMGLLDLSFCSVRSSVFESCVMLVGVGERDILTLVGDCPVPDTTILTESPMVTVLPLEVIFTSSRDTGGISRRYFSQLASEIDKDHGRVLMQGVHYWNFHCPAEY